MTEPSRSGHPRIYGNARAFPKLVPRMRIGIHRLRLNEGKMSGSARKRKASGSGETQKDKKKRLQSYVVRYTETYPCILPSKDPHRVQCKVCGSEFGIGTGGIDDIKTHVEGPRHKKNALKIEKQKEELMENSRLNCQK